MNLWTALQLVLFPSRRKAWAEADEHDRALHVKLHDWADTITPAYPGDGLECDLADLQADVLMHIGREQEAAWMLAAHSWSDKRDDPHYVRNGHNNGIRAAAMGVYIRTRHLGLVEVPKPQVYEIQTAPGGPSFDWAVKAALAHKDAVIARILNRNSSIH